jgi:hypothetical protein
VSALFCLSVLATTLLIAVDEGACIFFVFCQRSRPLLSLVLLLFFFLTVK